MRLGVRKEEEEEGRHRLFDGRRRRDGGSHDDDALNVHDNNNVLALHDDDDVNPAGSPRLIPDDYNELLAILHHRRCRGGLVQRHACVDFNVPLVLAVLQCFGQS